MKQIRRAEMENERLEDRDNHTRDDNDAKNLTAEAKGSKARADNLATEAKGGKARTEENSNKSETATEMINKQGGEFPFVMGSEFPRNEVKMIIDQRTETGIQTSERDTRWENNGKVTGETPIGGNDLTIGE